MAHINADISDSSHKHYSRILLSVTLSIIITVLILSTVLYANFENISLSLIHTFIKENLSQVSYSVNFMSDSAKALGLQIYFDRDVAKLLYSSPDPTELTAALNRLNSYRSTTPFIEHIYIIKKVKPFIQILAKTEQ